MRLLSKVVLGGGVVSAATAGTLVALGVFATSATLVVIDPVARPAAAGPDALKPFGSCAELLDWYVTNGVKDVGPYGWNDQDIWFSERGFSSQRLSDFDSGLMTRSAKSLSNIAAEAAVPGSTGTNTQEAAVDEPDVAKTDGDLVARIIGGRLVLVDVSGAEPSDLGELTLPRGGYGSELLLIGDRVVITQQLQGSAARQGMSRSSSKKSGYYRPGVLRILDVDISDPSRPELVRKDVYSGTLASVRQYGDTVRLVTATGRPELDWVRPGNGVSLQQANHANKDLVRASTIEDWLPRARTYGPSKALVDCDQVFHPEKWSGAETVAVTTYDAAEPAERTSTGVTASGQVVYSSGDRLYVASSEQPRRVFKNDQSLRSRRMIGPGAPTTFLHAFALDGKDTSYVGSGHVDGSVRDRWALDEYDGKLRVAWSRFDQRGHTTNGISVLSERDGRLVQTGSVDGLGDDENIQAVRWFDDLAIMVTFRRIDPLYTVDLSDQDNPRTRGELKIPGFSGYLHPIGADLLLGLGVDGKGAAQAAVFDISDLDDPTRVSVRSFDRGTVLPALQDPREFNWLDAERTGVTPLSAWGRETPGLLALKVSKAGKLESERLVDLNQSYGTRTLPLPEGRVAVLDKNRVRLLTIG